MSITSVASLAIAALTILHLLLSYNVSRLRLVVRKQTDPKLENELQKAIRAHGNAAEHNGILIALFIWLAFNESQTIQSSLILLITIIALIGLRIAHCIGLLVVEKAGDRHPLRYAGALGTYVGFGVLSVYLILITIEVFS